jgi:hypothetical protein
MIRIIHLIQTKGKTIMANRKFEVIMNGERYLMTEIPDSVASDKSKNTGVFHLVKPGLLESSPETVIADIAYNELTFHPLPFFIIKPV